MQTEFENCSAQLDGMSTGHQSVRPSSVTSATFEKIGVPQSTRKGGQADSAKLIWLAEGPTLTILESHDSALVGKWTLSLPNFDSAQIHCVTDFNMGKRGTWFLVSALLTRNAEIRSTQQPILALIDPLRPSVPVTWKTIAQVVTTLARNPANKGASSQRPDTVICGTAVGEIFEICIPTADLIAEPAIVVRDRPGNAVTSIRVVEDKGICVVGYADGRVQVRSLKDRKGSWKLLHEERHSGRVMHMALQVAPTPNDNVEEEKKDQQEETEMDPEEVAAAAKAKKLMDDLIQKADNILVGKGLSSAPPKKGRKGRMTEREEDEQLLATGLGDDGEAPVTHLQKQPSILSGATLRDYQMEGLNWLIKLYCSGISGILADEMGLGKTIQSISMVAYLKQFCKSKGPHLVCVPLSTLGNWVREFARFTPTIKVFKFHGSKEDRKQMKQDLQEQDAFEVLLTSYEMANMEQSFLKKFSWEFIVVDEAHRLKNENSLLSKVLRVFSSKFRLLLTGTPLQNNLHELWALLNFLLPDLFNRAEDFDAMFSSAGSDDLKSGLLTKLHRILRPFMLRRLKSDVECNLLPKKETLVYVGMSEMQRKVYSSIISKEFDALVGTAQTKRLLNIVMQLRKAANHPYLFEGVEDRSLAAYDEHLIFNSGKVLVLDKLLARLRAQDSRVLIFSQMTRTLDILEDYCVYRQLPYCRIDGGTSTETREEMMHTFNAEGSEKFVFLLSTRAGGLGINLATADIVVLYDSDWNPQMDLQAQDRAHRIGQKKQVQVFRFVTEDSIEEKILEKAEIKLRLDAMVIQSGKLNKHNKMSKDDMVEMIRYGADRVLRAGNTNNGTVTDADIDAILQKGEQKTKDMRSKLDSHMGTIKFSLDGNIQGNALSTENQDGDELLSAINQKAQEMLLLESLQDSVGKRQRKVKHMEGYNVADWHRQLLAVPKVHKSLLLKPHRVPKMSDYQFYSTTRIEQLIDKEQRFWNKHCQDADPPALSGLSEAEIKELETLIEDGFTWNRNDFRAFVRANERFGRDNVDKISSHVPGKSPEEVKRYHAVFWKEGRYKEIATGDKIEQQIAKGEAKLEKTAKLRKIMKFLLKGYTSRQQVASTLPIKYKGAQKGRGFSGDEDRYLVWQTNQLGYGEWDELAKRARDDEELTFDYYLKSRTPAELNRRVDTIIRMREKEYDQDLAMSKKRKAELPVEALKAGEEE
eukprot:CAMPEP_0175170234 /NCGR_PEP_ID=MMETSP0087-20121206/30095_1 /TAXON_ID=136419 /ORGANISM="Unknown Unknown, Strain D1" /LENGTH=1207 /DNA_ID=CAMNT_0016460833 /DNA_START=1 /DNA_END=3624 /DNA_ORIENTATION=-